MTDTTPPSSNTPSDAPTTTQLPAGELPPGWSLLGGQYEIVRLIASGGFGITYLARDTLGRDVAVKECFPLGLAQRQGVTHTVSATSAGTSEHFETARGQFLREARMLAKLDHPNVVRVQTLFEENGTAYMAMDFIHGRDLHEEIVASEGGMDPMRVLELARDLLGALEYVHGTGVLHRDIKPQNIRIDRFGMPMLIDFGAARAETQARSRMAGTFRVVTDGYSPHEFYVAGAKQGPHSDLYALAATLHHAITGKAPIAADERASALATGEPDPYQPIAPDQPHHDGRLLSLIDRALRMSPGDRPETAAVWLTQLADAPTTLVTPMAAPAPAPAAAPAPPPAKGRFVPGLLVGALAMGAVGGGIYAAQPKWLMPAMGEMEVRMGELENNLAAAQSARAAAQEELTGLQDTLSSAEAELARLQATDGEMAATMAELDAATAARDAAAEQITALEAELAALAATQTALEEAQVDRDTALDRVRELEADGTADAQTIADLQAQAAAATARIQVLEGDVTSGTATAAEAAAEIASLTAQVEAAQNRITMLGTEAIAARSRIGELEAEVNAANARIAQLQQALTQARADTSTTLAQMRSDLNEAEAALYTATTRANTLEQDLAEALAGNADLATLQAEMRALEAALAASERERDRLSAAIAAAAANASTSEANEGELQRLRSRVAELQAENAALANALARAEDALARATAAPVDTRPWLEGPRLVVPNGTLALLPRFSWDNRTVALADSTGGIALFDRSSGVYSGHLARGIPSDITRISFSSQGGYLIATTPNGTPNRLFNVTAQRELLRFSPSTVTTAARAISPGEDYFLYTRTAGNGATEVMLLPLDQSHNSNVTPTERLLTRIPAGQSVRVAFAQTTNDIVVITPNQVQVYRPDGSVRQSAPNRIGEVLAMAPIGRDSALLVLRNDGAVVVFDNPISQQVLATIPARASYTSYRLSGDRLHFYRANADVWEVLDLRTGTIRGAGPVGQGYAEADISISPDGSMIFIGAVGPQPARLLDVDTGAELQQFGDAQEGYFSFDNLFLATGQEGARAAQVWRLNDAGYYGGD